MAKPNLTETFIKCTSQTMCGIKPANLFSVSREEMTENDWACWVKNAAQQGLEIKALKKSEDMLLVFIYSRQWLNEILSDFEVKNYLLTKGYSLEFDLDLALSELFIRLVSESTFPHEVGVFLGYPVRDVIRFEEENGKCCKYCGYWKSYDNPEEAKKCCDRYRLCSQLCRQWFDEGFSIPQIIKKYKKLVQEAA